MTHWWYFAGTYCLIFVCCFYRPQTSTNVWRILVIQMLLVWILLVRLPALVTQAMLEMASLVQVSSTLNVSQHNKNIYNARQNKYFAYSDIFRVILIKSICMKNFQQNTCTVFLLNTFKCWYSIVCPKNTSEVTKNIKDFFLYTLSYASILMGGGSILASLVCHERIIPYHQIRFFKC